MNDKTVDSPRTPSATWIGLFIALFAMLLVRQAVNWYWPDPNFASAVAKEAGIWVSAAILLIIIWRGERLPLTSVGIGTAPLGKSLLWGLVLTVVCFLAAGPIAHLTGYGQAATNPAAAAFDKLPIWLLCLIMVRAGVVEELFYRGYAIERLMSLGLNRYVAGLVPLIIFGIGHWTGGGVNIVIALVVGAILTAFYIWKRDLVANMLAHFLIDFISNVLPKLFGAGHGS